MKALQTEQPVMTLPIFLIRSYHVQFILRQSVFIETNNASVSCSDPIAILKRCDDSQVQEQFMLGLNLEETCLGWAIQAKEP